MMHIKLELRKWLRLSGGEREIEMVVHDRQLKVYDSVEIDSGKGKVYVVFNKYYVCPTFVVTFNFGADKLLEEEEECRMHLNID